MFTKRGSAATIVLPARGPKSMDKGTLLGFYEITGPQVGRVRPLFRTEDATRALFDVSADGQRFVIPFAPEQKSSQPLTLIHNWTAAIRK